jgi:hypothetical protein
MDKATPDAAPRTMRLLLIHPATAGGVMATPDVEVGLQTRSGTLTPGTAGADGAVRYEVEAQRRTTRAGAERLAGDYVHGPNGDLFLYISARRRGGGEPWLRRIKVPVPAAAPADAVVLEATIEDARRSRARLAGDGWHA